MTDTMKYGPQTPGAEATAHADEWPTPDYWCTICDRGAEGCTHNPSDIPAPPGTETPERKE